jgi:Holliday junction resolvase RusA-like endonuclease
MYRKNEQHQQMPMFSTLDDLPDKQRQRLEASWAATFYEDFFCRIDEDIFEILYSDKASRPNVPVNVLVGLEALKAGFGWSDAQLEAQMAFNIQVRYALGYRDLTVGHFELRTVYNFRRRLTQHMQMTGENLLEEAFEQVTDEQIAALELKTGKLRMDSTQIASNIRQMSRIQLLVEVVQRVWRMLNTADRTRYEAVFEPYSKGTSGQYTYHIEPGEGARHLTDIGHLMRQLVIELAADYGEEAAYQVLGRVYGEHFIEEDTALRSKVGQELSAHSLQSPDDWEATYRKKRGQNYKGYVTNVTETCDPDNDLQLIVKVQTASNTADDAALLDEVVPELVDRTDVDEMHTDGGYNSPDVDETLQAAHIEQVQTAIRGKKSADKSVSVSDFIFIRNEDGTPQAVCCPRGQDTAVIPARKSGRFTAQFDADQCAACLLFDQCPTKQLKRKPTYRILRFDRQQVNVAHRHENQRQAKASGRNLRSAVEATVRSVKHPFRNGKLPVRGKPRVSMMLVASAAMVNVRRIWRYQTEKNEAENMQKAAGNASRSVVSFDFRTFWRLFCRSLETQSLYSPMAV